MTAMNDDARARGEDRVIHEVDGIEEFDNHLPNWWLATLFGAIAFACMYWFYFHVFDLGEQPARAYRREMAALAEKQGKDVAVTGEALVDMSKDAAVVADGAAVFTSTCVACHAANGGGNVGPNLTDEFWLHGGSPEQIYQSVRDGYPAKGMPAWGPQLGGRRVQAAAVYVLTLRNSNVPGGKPPQGEKFATK